MSFTQQDIQDLQAIKRLPGANGYVPLINLLISGRKLAPYQEDRLRQALSKFGYVIAKRRNMVQPVAVQAKVVPIAVEVEGADAEDVDGDDNQPSVDAPKKRGRPRKHQD